jgi:hypothetical protein
MVVGEVELGWMGVGLWACAIEVDGEGEYMWGTGLRHL